MLNMIMRTLVLVLLFVPHLTQAARVQKFDQVNNLIFPPRVSPMHILGEELTPAARPHGEEASPTAYGEDSWPMPAARPHGEEPLNS